MNHSKRTYRTKKITTFAAIAYVLLTGTAVFAMDGDDDHRTSAGVSPTASPAAGPSLEQEEPKAGTHGLPVHHAVRLSVYFSSEMDIPPQYVAGFILPDGTAVSRNVLANTRIGLSDDITFRGNEINIPYEIGGGEYYQFGVYKAPIKTNQYIKAIRLHFKWEGCPNCFSDYMVGIKYKSEKL